VGPGEVQRHYKLYRPIVRSQEYFKRLVLIAVLGKLATLHAATYTECAAKLSRT
jgi:hypothetical protein